MLNDLMPHPFARWIDPINIWFLQPEHQWLAWTLNGLWVLAWIAFFVYLERRSRDVEHKE